MNKIAKRALSGIMAVFVAAIGYTSSLPASALEIEKKRDFNIFLDAGGFDDEFVSQMHSISDKNSDGSYFSTMVMVPGENEMTIDGKKVNLSVAVDMGVGGEIILPAEEIAEAIGATAQVDRVSGELNIVRGEEKIKMGSSVAELQNNLDISDEYEEAMSSEEEAVLLDNATVSEQDAEDQLCLDVKAVDGKIVVTSPYQSKQIILYVKGGRNLSQNYGATDFATNGKGLYFLQYETEKQTKAAFEAFEASNAIEYVTVNGIMTLDSTASTESSSINLGSWGTDGDGVNSMGIQAGRMKNILSGNQNEILVGVVDTGVDSKYLNVREGHEFLQGRTTEPSSATDDTKGYDVVNSTNNAMDIDSHGTHVSGTIVDCTPDNVKVLPVKAAKIFNEGTSREETAFATSDVVLGMHYAAEHGAKVINLSLGGACAGNCLKKEAIESINAQAAERGENPPVFVIAAGNDGTDVGSHCPARHSLDFDNVITVGAVDKYDLPAFFSNYGQAVDVCAPGVSINSCVPGNEYALYSGTSMATPHVSAAVAMLILRHPDYTPAQIKALLKSMTVDLNTAGWDGATGSGRIDFRMLDDSLCPKISPIAATAFTLKNTSDHQSPTNFTQGTIDTSFGNIPMGVVVSPKEATDKTVTYSSANDNVVKVENSRAFATGAGTVTITASKGSLPSKQASITVNDFWAYHPAESFAGGTGSASSPYLIATAEQLSKIVYDVKFKKATYGSKHFKLISDIDLSLRRWEPISLISSVTFDGNGYAIKNANIKITRKYSSSTDNWVVTGGLFNSAITSTVSNLAIINASVGNGNDPDADYLCGILCGLAIRSNFENCFVEGSVPYGAGVVGSVTLESNILNCYSKVTNAKAGIVRSLGASTVKNCYSSGTLCDNGAGLVSSMTNLISDDNLLEASIINSFSAIDSTSEIGFVGNKNSGKIIDSYYHSGNTYGVKTDLNSSDTDLTARTISTFKNKSFYTTAGNWDSSSPWDFNTVWDIDSNYNNGLPFQRQFHRKVYGIKLNKTAISLCKGETEQLTATVLPTYAVNRNVVWSSSNPSAATVDQTGKVTGKLSTGTATITATATDGSGVSASCAFVGDTDYWATPEKASTITLHSQKTGKISGAGDIDCFKYVADKTGDVIFYTTGSLDTKGYLLDENKNQIAQNDDASISGRNFAIKYNVQSGKTYYIKVGAYSTNTGSYTLNVARGVYNASIPSLNPDARCVQMNVEAASILTNLQIKIGSKTYNLTKPSSGSLDTTVNGARFKVTFTSKNSGFSTLWTIKAKIPSSTVTQSVSFTFSKGGITGVTGRTITGFLPYKSSIKTNINPSSNLQTVINGMSSSGYSFTVKDWNNNTVTVSSTAKAATGMKIIKTNTSTGKITEIFYVLVYGDVKGGTNCGDGIIENSDALSVLQYATGKATPPSELVKLAADVNHDGAIDSDDALLIQQHAVGSATINQNVSVTNVPDDCYYTSSVAF